MSECQYCGTTEEIRPYGPNASYLCWDCMMADPQRQLTAMQQCEEQIRACGPNVVIGEKTGPRPLKRGNN